MEYEDRISIATPEGIELEVTLAGIGSRFVAQLLDQLLQWALYLAFLTAATIAADGIDSPLLAAGLVLAFFLVMLGYPVLFETLASGRTPGKRATGLRVLEAGGRPVGFRSSVIRNVVRVIDALPGTYLVAMIAVLASKRNQRLGDMAAGTIVVMERTGGRRRKSEVPEWRRATTRQEPSPESATWDVSAVTADELSTVRRYLERRDSLTPEARSQLAMELATRLRPKIVGPSPDMHPEELLLELAAVKAARG